MRCSPWPDVSDRVARHVVDHLYTAHVSSRCLLYTSDAADERSSVDLGGRRIIKKKKLIHHDHGRLTSYQI